MILCSFSLPGICSSSGEGELIDRGISEGAQPCSAKCLPFSSSRNCRVMGCSISATWSGTHSTRRVRGGFVYFQEEALVNPFGCLSSTPCLITSIRNTSGISFAGILFLLTWFANGREKGGCSCISPFGLPQTAVLHSRPVKGLERPTATAPRKVRVLRLRADVIYS